MANQQALLTRAQALMQQGEPAAAARLAMPFARANPQNLQLLMFVARAARDGGEHSLALEALTMARALSPGDPHLANIEANTLAAAGRAAEALAAFERLLTAHPRFIDGHVNRALVAKEAGEHEKALALLDESLAILNGHARLLSAKGAVLKELGRLEDALAVLDDAASADPSQMQTQLHRGLVLHALCEFEAAEGALEVARGHGATDRPLKSALAAVKLELDKVEEAEALYFEAFAAGDPEAGRALTRLRREYRGLDDPFDHYAMRARALPGHPLGWHEYLAERLAYKDYDGLRRAAAEARIHHPDDRLIESLQAFAIGKSDRDAAALDRLVQLSREDEDNVSLHCAVAEIALIQQEAELARTHAEAATRLAPLDQAGWCYLATAYRLLEDAREFALCDYENFIIEVPVLPLGRDLSAREYADEVAEVLSRLHRTKRAPGNQSLRGGTQTSGALFARRGAQIADFREAILAAVHRGAESLRFDATHPLLSRKTQAVAIAGSWSVRLARGDGHHVSHFHGQGWISSAYYAQLPRLGKGRIDGEGGEEGFIQFGSPPADWGLGLPPRKSVRPEPGKLVLFPSYMWHSTVPFTGEGTRLTAAFDFVPA